MMRQRTGNPCFVKRGHFPIDFQGSVNERDSQTGAGPLAKTHSQIQKRVKPQVIEDDPMSGLL